MLLSPSPTGLAQQNGVLSLGLLSGVLSHWVAKLLGSLGFSRHHSYPLAYYLLSLLPSDGVLEAPFHTLFFSWSLFLPSSAARIPTEQIEVTHNFSSQARLL